MGSSMISLLEVRELTRAAPQIDRSTANHATPASHTPVLEAPQALDENRNDILGSDLYPMIPHICLRPHP